MDGSLNTNFQLCNLGFKWLKTIRLDLQKNIINYLNFSSFYFQIKRQILIRV